MADISIQWNPYDCGKGRLKLFSSSMNIKHTGCIVYTDINIVQCTQTHFVHKLIVGVISIGLMID